jgi:hypothetical protein
MAVKMVVRSIAKLSEELDHVHAVHRHALFDGRRRLVARH